MKYYMDDSAEFKHKTQHSFLLWENRNVELFFIQYLLYDMPPVNTFKAQTLAFTNEIHFTELRRLALAGNSIMNRKTTKIGRL